MHDDQLTYTSIGVLGTHVNTSFTVVET